ncbi:hypothetical protein ARAM_005405 [Aspergillus rambellii]|uniref:Uncharacterized protein n=1 Tax=Aspergillus rambellii TaxID=308745 RepID=A0A0F8XH64_9EURO|nr:hypothetical protein ARAM_005405 [Aspergillus rambellii]
MELEPVRSVPRDAGSIDMEDICQNTQLLPEDTLQKIAKGPLVKFTIACDDIQKVTRLFESLRLAFASTAVTHSHTTAACNALSAFLDAAFVSKREETRRLARSQEVWVSVFVTFLNRYKDVKPRPMKQVLESLVVILAKTRDEPQRDSIQERIVDEVLPSVILGEARSRLKASILAMEMLVRKNAILPIELISAVDAWLLKNPKQWPSVLQEECQVSGIDPSLFLRRSSEDTASRVSFQKTATEILVFGVLNRAKAVELAPSVGEVLAYFFQKLQLSVDSCILSREDGESLASVWVKPVKYFLLKNLDILEKLSNHILHSLFSVSTGGFLRFIETLPLKSLLDGDMSSSSSAELTVLFASLQIAKKAGLVHEDLYFSRASTASKQAESAIVLKSELIGQFLFHHNFNIRMAALSLLVTAPSTTKPVSAAAIRVVLKSLPSLHAESDPCSRGEILTLIRGLIVRVKGGILADKENPVEEKITVNKKKQLVFARDDAETEACMKNYLEFLLTDLRPTASYHRHIMALKTLILLLESGLDDRYTGSVSGKPEGRQVRWKFNMDIFGSRLLRLLVDLLLDPFEEVRGTALNILKLFPLPVLLGGASHSAVGKPELIDAITKAEQLASNTSRADHADTVARLFYLIFCTASKSKVNDDGIFHWWDTKAGVVEMLLGKLEEKLSLPEGLFHSSLRDAPLHGYLCALRYIVSTPNFYSVIPNDGPVDGEIWRAIHSRISSCCDKIWDEVKPVLCIDSPEGHAAEPIEDLKVGPKDILSYSWRALRESSLLLNATLSNETYGPELGLNREDYDKIGRASFTQLAELRHRGAFSTVAQTFASCCQRCGQSKKREISELPLLWYQEAKKIIFESASKLTRRSAGLPALIAGILLSKPGGPLFHQVIQELQDISHLPAKHDEQNQVLELPQVHSMNCLKEIFTNARLGPHTEAFIMPALNLSAERMGSPIWALRNSGLMLFRALLNRMCRTDFVGFGGQSGSEPGARISFQKYPGLVPLLSALLEPPKQIKIAEQGDTAMVTERVFPALELIAEKMPNSPDTHDDMLRALVREHLKSPVWGIREHAARVYASLLNRSDIIENIQSLLKARDAKTQNYLHGEALCIKYSLRRFSCLPFALWNERVGEVKSTIEAVFSSSFPAAVSPFLVTTLLEILSDAVEKSIENGVEGEMIPLLDKFFETYDIIDNLDYVFDSSHPSWTTLSTTRAFSLLRRELAWITVLKKLVKGETDDLVPFMLRIATLDPNTCQWLLEQTHATFGVKEHYRGPLLDLYKSTILEGSPVEVKIPAISNLAANLQFLVDFNKTEVPSIDLPWEALAKEISINSTSKGFNRDRADVELQLQGCLLATKSIILHQELSETEILQWATRLRFALQEDTEFTTRYAAATSITAFARVLRPLGMAPRVDAAFLEVYLILYDLLNDDDEELRDIAASTASWILSFSSVSPPQKNVTLSPLNASELFAAFIAENYPSSQLLGSRAIRYILGQESRIGDSTSNARLLTVSTVIHELRQDSTILFEEEKQNLFVEEVREIDIWSGVLSQLAHSSYNEPLLKETFQWVCEGLSCFSETLASENGEDGLIGWTSKPETYILGVRVISLASVMVSKDFAGSGLLGEGKAALKDRLLTLLGRGKEGLLHVDLVSRIQLGLESS